MKYYFEKNTNYDFDTAVKRIKEELQKEGFGILVEIDMKKTLKEKINIDFTQYKILGACNPPFAYESLKVEDNIGIMLPCNIVIRETKDQQIKVAVVNPVFAMQSVKNDKMAEIAQQIQIKLKNALNTV